MNLSKMKKILSATVSLMMAASALPLTTYAEGNNGWGNGSDRDWSGFAGGFETTGNENIGSDAGSGGNAVPAPAPTAVPATIIASASIPCGGGKGTLKNVKRAAKSVNGTTLGTDELFSFNKVVGARSKKRGYGAGTAVTAAGVLSDVLRLQNWTREL